MTDPTPTLAEIKARRAALRDALKAQGTANYKTPASEDFHQHARTDVDALIKMVEDAHAADQVKIAALVAALEALGCKPDGYCFCLSREQIEAGHTGECLDARAALAASFAAADWSSNPAAIAKDLGAFGGDQEAFERMRDLYDKKVSAKEAKQ